MTSGADSFYQNNQEFLKDLEDALCEMTGADYISKDILEDSAKNIDLFLQSFL
jgi:hypothetical protein